MTSPDLGMQTRTGNQRPPLPELHDNKKAPQRAAEALATRAVSWTGPSGLKAHHRTQNRAWEEDVSWRWGQDLG